MVFKGNLILFSYHIKRREVLTFQPTTGLFHKHFKLCFSIIQLCILCIPMCIFHQNPFCPVIPSSPSSCLEKADMANSLIRVFTCKSDSSLRSRALLSWDLAGVLQQWTGGMMQCSRCNPNSHEGIRSACRHMRQQCSSMHRVIAVIHCWIGMAIQSTTVVMLGEMCWICALAPLSLSGFSYAVRDPPREPVPVLQSTRALAFLTDWFVIP